jgi:site-specific DNA-methyltransferase (adenine-specific)
MTRAGSEISFIDTTQTRFCESDILGFRPRESNLEKKFAAKVAAWNRRPEILNTVHDFFEDDARQMNCIATGKKVHLVVTSPPYWNLKKYSEEGDGLQLGHIDSREDFLDELGKVWKNCFDRLVPGGRMCVVVGDVCRSRKKHGRHLVDPLHAYIQVQCQ